MQHTWQEGLETGVRDVDAEHRLHASLIHALELLLGGGDDPALAERTTAQLMDFTSAHFRSEELLMRLYAYPRLEAHEQEHAALTVRVQEISRKIADGAAPQALEALGALRAALTGHVRAMDQDFARHCLESAMKDIKSL